MAEPTILERLQAIVPKVDTPERLAYYQQFGIQYYADSAFFNLLREGMIHVIENYDPNEGGTVNDWGDIGGALSNQADLYAKLNNIFIVKDVSILSSDSTIQITTKINALAQYNVDETQLIVFSCTASDNAALKKIFISKGHGRGLFGSGGYQFTFADFLQLNPDVWEEIKRQAQSILGEWTFSVAPKVPTGTPGAGGLYAASQAYVLAAIAALDLNIKFSRTYPKQALPHTGTTNFTRIYTADIPAAAFINGALEFKFYWGATGTAGIKQFYGYLVKESDYYDTYPLNSTNRLFTAPIDSSVASLIGAYGQRLATLSGTNLSIWPTGSPTLSPVSTGQIFSVMTFTPNVNYKLIIAAQLGNSADSCWVEALQITSIKTAS